MAQSYRDLGNLPQAMELYEKRTTMGGWDEEVWHACYQVARMQHRLGIAWPLVLAMYLEAYRFRPSRLEPLFHVAKYYRETQQHQLGFLFSRPVTEASYPEDTLFVEKNIYQYELPLEYALCCAAVARQGEALRMYDRIIASPDTPETVRAAAEADKLRCLAATR